MVAFLLAFLTWVEILTHERRKEQRENFQTIVCITFEFELKCITLKFEPPFTTSNWCHILYLYDKKRSIPVLSSAAVRLKI